MPLAIVVLSTMLAGCQSGQSDERGFDAPTELATVRHSTDTGGDTGGEGGAPIDARTLLEQTGVLAGGGHGTYCAMVGGLALCTDDVEELLGKMEAEPVSVRYCWLYEHIDYGGSAAWIDFDVADLRSLYSTNWEDRISGVMCSLAGAQLWEHRNYNTSGVRKTFYWDSNLVNDGWNDKASSIRFR